GAVQALTLSLPLSAPKLRKTDAAVIQKIDRLLDDHTDGEIAAILNAKGMRSGEGKLFHRGIILRLRQRYHLANRFTRMRAAGMLTKEEIAALHGVSLHSVKVPRQMSGHSIFWERFKALLCGAVCRRMLRNMYIQYATTLMCQHHDYNRHSHHQRENSD